MRKIGDTVKLLREERRISQTKLADDLKISRSAISMYEANERIPTEDVKEIICDYFNVDMNYLYGKTNVRNSSKELDQDNEIILDEIKVISRAAKKMSDKEREVMINLLKAAFEDKFDN